MSQGDDVHADVAGTIPAVMSNSHAGNEPAAATAAVVPPALTALPTITIASALVVAVDDIYQENLKAKALSIATNLPPP